MLKIALQKCDIYLNYSKFCSISWKFQEKCSWSVIPYDPALFMSGFVCDRLNRILRWLDLLASFLSAPFDLYFRHIKCEECPFCWMDSVIFYINYFSPLLLKTSIIKLLLIENSL